MPNHIITNCYNFSINASDELLKLNTTEKFFIEITHCHSFSIQGLKTIGGRNIITTSDSSNFTLSNCKSQNACGYGIIAHNSTQFTIENCRFQHNLSGIMVVGQSANGLIVNCTCKGLYGFYNCDAGIHLCATSLSIKLKHIPEQCHEPLSIEEKTFRPQKILIKSCILSECRAQGIYLEGAVNCLIENNTIIDNNKEGICFDWGSCYNIFINNIISLNGERRNVSDEERRVDFITKYPLLKDGSSSMKLPGISLDNGCMNLIDSNKIVGNYGGGIKMVRSSMLNKISNNLIISNAIGKNTFIPYFHGISALGVGAVNNEFNGDRNTLLAFLPSILNSINSNIIQGHSLATFHDNISRNNFFSNNLLDKKTTIPHKIKELFSRSIALLRRMAWRTLGN